MSVCKTVGQILSDTKAGVLPQKFGLELDDVLGRL
jgi:hypothetical protein